MPWYGQLAGWIVGAIVGLAVLFHVIVPGLSHWGVLPPQAGAHSSYRGDVRGYNGRDYRANSVPQYAPRRVEHIPQRQPQGAWRCEVGGRPGWCR